MKLVTIFSMVVLSLNASAKAADLCAELEKGLRKDYVRQMTDYEVKAKLRRDNINAVSVIYNDIIDRLNNDPEIMKFMGAHYFHIGLDTSNLIPEDEVLRRMFEAVKAARDKHEWVYCPGGGNLKFTFNPHVDSLEERVVGAKASCTAHLGKYEEPKGLENSKYQGVTGYVHNHALDITIRVKSSEAAEPLHEYMRLNPYLVPIEGKGLNDFRLQKRAFIQEARNTSFMSEDQYVASRLNESVGCKVNKKVQAESPAVEASASVTPKKVPDSTNPPKSKPSSLKKSAAK